MVSKLASAIYNDVVGGLAGYSSTPSMSMEQLEDEIIEERLLIIKEYTMKNLIPRKDLLMSINCIPVDCESLDKCPCGDSHTPPIAHFEIPQIMNDIQGGAIEYAGSVDKSTPFKVYTSQTYLTHRYKLRGANKPYVYIDPTPNENNMYDGWIFNAPMIQVISVIGVFKDIRQLENYACCAGEELDNYTFIATEIKKRLTEKKLRYYRQFLPQPHPNTQAPK